MIEGTIGSDGAGRGARSTSFADSIDEALRPQPMLHGFAAAPRNVVTRPVSLPPWFIDRCRRAYLSVDFGTGPRALGVTSPQLGEGRTSVAIGIALAMASDTQEPTLLLECDLERAAFGRYLQIPDGGGLSDWLDGAGPLRVVRMPFLPNLAVMPSGAARTDAPRLLYQLTSAPFMEDLSRRFSNIVLDLPPMLDLAYSSLAVKLVNRLLLVVRYGQTPTEDLERALFLLGRERVAGLVVNGTTYRSPEWLRRLF